MWRTLLQLRSSLAANGERHVHRLGQHAGRDSPTRLPYGAGMLGNLVAEMSASRRAELGDLRPVVRLGLVPATPAFAGKRVRLDAIAGSQASAARRCRLGRVTSAGAGGSGEAGSRSWPAATPSASKRRSGRPGRRGRYPARGDGSPADGCVAGSGNGGLDHSAPRILIGPPAGVKGNRAGGQGPLLNRNAGWARQPA
jgi:hypothetical protein